MQLSETSPGEIAVNPGVGVITLAFNVDVEALDAAECHTLQIFEESLEGLYIT